MIGLDSKNAAELLTSAILLVDDEPTNIKLLEKMLQKAGYTNIESVMDPRDVANKYSTQRSDLILLDINMPVMDGFEVMEDLKLKHGDKLAPILVLTAQHSQDFRLRALNSGARDFLTKPFDRTELLARVRILLEAQGYYKAMRNQNEILEEMVSERTKELNETRLQIVRRLGRAAEYRDNETGLHIIRMSRMSALLGRRAGLSEQESDLLLHASPMHDIGKIGIPDQILLKPGKLTPEEWKIMKTHTTIGADILSGDESLLLKKASLIALTHHEKWDGSGYPARLIGKEIPLEGRIVALADVFDALTSKRPYKEPWSTADSIEYMKEQKNRHFDPELFENFLELLPEIIEIKDQHMEPGDSEKKNKQPMNAINSVY